MKVLFMCTANSCRSVLSEGLFNHLAPDGFTAVSSGSFPSGQLNPRAVSTLQALGIDTSGLYSKGSEVFSDSPPDVVITVCDKAGSADVHRRDAVSKWCRAGHRLSAVPVCAEPAAAAG